MHCMCNLIQSILNTISFPPPAGNFANRSKEEVQEIAAKGGHASHGGGRPTGSTTNSNSSSGNADPYDKSTEDTFYGDDNDDFEPPKNVDIGYSEPAHHTRAQDPMDDDEKPLSQQATDQDEIITYGGKQGFASMVETDPERQKEIARSGGTGPRSSE